jgi:hypothetical protein
MYAMLKRLFTNIWKELLFIVIFIMLYRLNPTIGKTYLSMEVFFIATLTPAIFFRAKENYRLSFRFFLLNRMIGVMTPLIALCAMAYTHVSIIDYSYVYALLCIEACVSAASISVFAPRFWALTVRAATLDDIKSLVEIEKECFTDIQQASKEQIIKRIETSPGTCLIAEHKKHGVVGSLYVRPVNKYEVVRHKKSHKAIQNNDNFSKKPHHNALYIIGIQAKNIHGIPIALYLEAGLGKLSMEHKYTGIMGGPRIPEYHQHSHLSVEEFFESSHCKFLWYLMRNATIPGICRPEILCALEDYFPDPESLNYAALTWFPTPLHNVPATISTPISRVLYWLAIC